MYLHLVLMVLLLVAIRLCAVSIAALDVIIDENLPEHSNELGEYLNQNYKD